MAWIGISLVILNGARADGPTVRVAALRPNYPLPAFQDEVNTSPVRFEAIAEQAREAATQGAQIIYTFGANLVDTTLDRKCFGGSIIQAR